jgi:hypothetical protein
MKMIRNLAVTITRLLLERFKLSQDIKHLLEAITWAKNVATSPSDPNTPHKLIDNQMNHLTLLESCLREQYLFTGERDDIDEAISVASEIVKGTWPDDDVEKPQLCNLADSLSYRDQLSIINLIGNPASSSGFITDSDIDGSVSALKQAVDLAPDEHPYKSIYLQKLGQVLLRRFANRRAVDLDDVIQAQTQAVDLLPCRHVDRASYLSDLSSSLVTRFTRTHMSVVGDLDSSISAQQQAIGLTPDGDPFMPVRLGDLG